MNTEKSSSKETTLHHHILDIAVDIHLAFRKKISRQESKQCWLFMLLCIPTIVYHIKTMVLTSVHNYDCHIQQQTSDHF